MSSFVLVLLMQYVVYTKAGYVNHVEGAVNVKATDNVPAGAPIKTGSGGFAEILLNPGSYLRLGENSEAVLDGIELTHIALRLVSGSGVIEAIRFSKKSPLHVKSGNLEVDIVKDGIYKFSDGQAFVVTGGLQTPGNKIVFKKGWQVSNGAGFQALKVKTSPTPLEFWSRNRSKAIAEANMSIVRSLRGTSALNSLTADSWLWVPTLGAFTFMPVYGFRSPYGYSYTSVTDTNYVNGSSGYPNRADSGNGTIEGLSGGGGGGGGVPIQSEATPREVDRGSPSGGHLPP